MQVKRIYIKDFCAHAETQFSFDDFSSAIVIGKIRGNDNFSNGSGKSTIFNAIEYALFNEVKFSSLEKSIRDGCDTCIVELEFLSSIDNVIYKIVRSNNRKTGTDLRLFKLNNNEWEDTTQRRVIDTEKEILKLIGFNYKAFCASSLFGQSGSENNVQKDYSNLAALTPEKRKSVLREVLQLNVYSNYEKLAKTKCLKIQNDLEEVKLMIKLIDDPDKEIKKLSEQLIKINDIFNEQTVLIQGIKNNLSTQNNNLTLVNEKIKNIRNNNKLILDKKKETEIQLSKIKNTINDLDGKLKLLPQEANAISKKIEDKKAVINNLQTSLINIDQLELEKEELLNNLTNYISTQKSLKEKIAELKEPLPEGGFCKYCRQSLSSDHKNHWEETIKVDLEKLQQQLLMYNFKISELTSQRSKIEKSILDSKNNSKLINNYNIEVSSFNQDLENKRSLYKNYKSIIVEHTGIFKDKEIEYSKLKQELEIFNQNAHSSNDLEVKNLVQLINDLEKEERVLTSSINNLLQEKAVIDHKIKQSILNKDKLSSLSIKLDELQKTLNVHQQVVQAFSSSGIPSLIIHTVLDELQLETNKWLIKLRPGLQLKFLICKDKNNGEQDDTLDLLFFIDGAQREYKQLSGAQKIIICLALKLGILFIMNKRLGVNINLLLLDEVDACLDEGGTEVFAEIIKIIHKEVKVLIVTHNPKLRSKFEYAVVVEQDENNVSRAELINW